MYKVYLFAGFISEESHQEFIMLLPHVLQGTFFN